MSGVEVWRINEQALAIHDAWMLHTFRFGDGPDSRAVFDAAIRDHLDRLDGTPESSVALLTGIDRDRIGEYGGMSEGER